MKHLLILLLVIITTTSCRQVMGDKSFGNHITLLAGDKKEDQAIVYCADESKPCSEGIYLVPATKSAEYVEDYKSNHDWIIARTVKDGKKYFWAINKDFALGDKNCKDNCGDYIKTFVNGPLEYEDFIEALDEWDVGMNLSKE